MSQASMRPISFVCDGDTLAGVLHEAGGAARVGVVVVVGGPQTRVGSHRQFFLLARELAAAGYPCLRFDYRGMGDSEGEVRDFEQIDSDIRAAIDCLCREQPSIERVVLWGLCDGASAAVFYASSDSRVAGLALLNPWVRTEAGAAAALITNYYGQRFLSLDFWRRLLIGEMNVVARAREFAANFVAARQAPPVSANKGNLPERFARGLTAFRGEILLVLSGKDLTAAEFRCAAAESPLEGALMGSSMSCIDLPEANHTFSSAAWRAEVERTTIDWLRRAIKTDGAG